MTRQENAGLFASAPLDLPVQYVEFDGRGYRPLTS